LHADGLQALQALLSGRTITTFRGGARCHRVSLDVHQHQRLESLAQAHRWDLIWVPAALETASFRVLAMDMDSTVITMECIDELAAAIGKGAEVAAITEAAMRGEIADFSVSLRRRVALLEGAPQTVIDDVLAHRLRYSPGAEALLAGARALGWRTLLVSGGFHAFADVVAAHLGFDRVCANQLQMHDGRLNGLVSGGSANGGAIVDGASKARQLVQFCADLGVSPSQAIAVGDGANDLDMMSHAGWSVAWRAKPRVRAAARCALDHAPLDRILNLFAGHQAVAPKGP
jgi:phosphoserine phosphatase